MNKIISAILVCLLTIFQSLSFAMFFDTSDIERLFSEGICFSCDYLKLPFTIASERYDLSRLCTGKIITDKRIALGK